MSDAVSQFTDGQIQEFKEAFALFDKGKAFFSLLFFSQSFPVSSSRCVLWQEHREIVSYSLPLSCSHLTIVSLCRRIWQN